MNAHLEPLSPPAEDVNSTQGCETIDQPLCDPQIPTEVIAALRRELFSRAAAGAPSMLDAIEFGKDMAQQALGEAWRWLIEGENQTAVDLKRSAHRILSWRLNDEYRKTEQRQATQSIDALVEEAGLDSLNALTANELPPDAILNRADMERLVIRALTKLSDPDHRKVLELRFWENLTNKQIADVFGTSERTVIRRYLEAEKAFRTALRSVTNDVTLNTSFSSHEY